MPEPSRPPWRIADGLGGLAIWSLVDQRVTLVIECDSCPHFAKWTPADLDRRFRRHRGRSLSWIAPRLRCSRCKSNWVRISAERGAVVGARPGAWG
ncbi:MAG: hypothetical protein P4L73_17570 [Caulobacteraceae bacterium]|nr:hypothetical protein [Caulobacteraceae bacterium]